MPQETLRPDAPNPTPTFVLEKNLFPFVTRLSVGDKGVMSVSGMVTGERIIEEDDLVVKTLRILRATSEIDSRET